MKEIGATEAQNNFGALLDTALQEPVSVTRKGRPVAVMLSQQEYDQLQEQLIHEKVKLGLEQAERGEVVDGKAAVGTLRAKLQAKKDSA